MWTGLARADKPADDVDYALPYLDATVITTGDLGYHGRSYRFAAGVQLGLTDEGLDGLDLRLGLCAHFAPTTTGFATAQGGGEVESTYRVLGHLRLGLHGTVVGAPGAYMFSFGGVVRAYDSVELRVEAYYATKNAYDTIGRPYPAASDGVLVGLGVGGDPRWYHWVLFPIAVLAANAAFKTSHFD
jgi:hypothetical protein